MPTIIVVDVDEDKKNSSKVLIIYSKTGIYTKTFKKSEEEEFREEFEAAIRAKRARKDEDKKLSISGYTKKDEAPGTSVAALKNRTNRTYFRDIFFSIN